MIRQEKGVVYSTDIAHALNFSKPNVSVAMKRLRGALPLPCSIFGASIT